MNAMKYTSITENHLFHKAYTKGKRSVGKLVAVYVLPDFTAEKRMRANPKKEYINRLGISVSKKLGGAVVRSRVRRIVREGYRTACKNGTVKKGRLIVIAARSASVNAKSTEVGAELCHAFSELGLYSSKQKQADV